MRGFLLCLLLPLALNAEDFAPWYGRDLEPHLYLTWNPELYDKIDAKGGDISYNETAHFVWLGVEGSYAAWDAQLDVILADTLHRNFGFDSARLTGRYQWFSDDLGDPFAFVTGITYIQAVTESVRDISSFHHSKCEGELHLALGRQCICDAFWLTRWWAFFALGLSDQGSPWLRGNLSFQKNNWDRNQLGVFARTLWGLGGDDLTSVADFDGYGPIRHQSVDLGLNFLYRTFCYGEWSAEYAYRVYARNFPEKVHQFRIQVMYPFGL